MLKEIVLSAYLSIVPVDDYLPPQISMPSLEGLVVVTSETYNVGNTTITMKSYSEESVMPNDYNLVYITSTRNNKKIPFCIYDGNNWYMYLDNGNKTGIPEDGWMDDFFMCKPGEVSAENLLPQIKTAYDRHFKLPTGFDFKHCAKCDKKTSHYGKIATHLGIDGKMVKPGCLKCNAYAHLKLKT